MFRNPRHADAPVERPAVSSQVTGSANGGRPSRGQLQYGLRSVLVAAFVFPVFCGLLTWLWRGRTQQAAVDAIIACGGRAQFTHEYDENGFDLPDPEPRGPRWLRRILGSHFFVTIIYAEATTDGEIETVAAFHGLRHLRLRHVPVGPVLCQARDIGASRRITSVGVEGLSRLRSLESLDMAYVPVTDVQMDSLTRGLTKLKSLLFDGRELSDDGLAKISRLRQLELLYVKIYNSRLRGRRLEDLASLPNLVQLEIYGNHIDEAGLRALGKFGRLQRLGLEGVTGPEMRSLAKLKQLKTLYLSEAHLTDLAGAQPRQVEGFSKLETLWLQDARVGDSGIGCFAGLRQLQKLNLNGTDITDAGLGHLEALENLKLLGLGAAKITDAGLKHLVRLKQLAILNVSHTQITDAGLDCLRSLPRLEGLVLGATRITDKGLNTLKGFKQLRHLDLQDTQVSDEGIADLRLALPMCDIWPKGKRSTGDDKSKAVVPRAEKFHGGASGTGSVLEKVTTGSEKAPMKTGKN